MLEKLLEDDHSDAVRLEHAQDAGLAPLLPVIPHADPAATCHEHQAQQRAQTQLHGGTAASPQHASDMRVNDTLKAGMGMDPPLAGPCTSNPAAILHRPLQPTTDERSTSLSRSGSHDSIYGGTSASVIGIGTVPVSSQAPQAAYPHLPPNGRYLAPTEAGAAGTAHALSGGGEVVAESGSGMDAILTEMGFNAQAIHTNWDAIKQVCMGGLQICVRTLHAL